MTGIPTLINGSPDATLSSADRGVSYGDGLFETIRIKDRKPVYWDLHLQRLLNGCEQLKLSIDPNLLPAQLLQDTLWLLRQQGTEDGVLKIIITRGSGQRGYKFSQDILPTRICSLANGVSNNGALKKQGGRLYSCQLKLGVQPLLAGLKHLNRLENVMARSEWDTDYDEGLLQDIYGNVIEGVMSNIFMVKDNLLLTPLLNTAGVSGIIRGRVIAWAHEQKLTVKEAAIPHDTLQEADHLFISNSLWGVIPIIHYNGHTFTHWSKHAALEQWLENDSHKSLLNFPPGH